MEKENKLLSVYPIEYLKYKFQQKYIHENRYFIINDQCVNENENVEELNNETFKNHPYLPVLASNFGRIKYKDKILKQNVLKEGYLYVNIPYEAINLKFETWEKNVKMENGMNTPIIESHVDYYEYEITKRIDEKFDWHPNIQIGISNYGNVKNLYNSKYYGKYFKIYEEKYVILPIYVYRIVAETWLDNPKYDYYNSVHHISNNGYDNTIYNLIWVGKDQHNEIEKK